MANGNNQNQSWWTTLPGVITSVSGLLTALGAFIVIYVQYCSGPVTPSTQQDKVTQEVKQKEPAKTNSDQTLSVSQTDNTHKHQAAFTAPSVSQNHPVNNEVSQTGPNHETINSSHARFEYTSRRLSAPVGQNTHQLRLFIEAAPEEIEKITAVTYYLHPTFPNPVIKVTNPSNNFELRIKAWGSFEAKAEIKYNTGQIITLKRQLNI